MPVVSSLTVTPGSGAVVFSPSSSNSTFASTTTSTTSSASSTSSGIGGVTGNNIGVGDGIFAGTTGTKNIVLNFKSLIGGTGINIVQSQQSITFIATGEVETGVTFASLPDGPGDFVPHAVLTGSATSNALVWSLPASVANTVLSFNGSTLTWSPAGISEINSLGTGYSLLGTLSLPTANFKSLYATGGISITSNAVGLILSGTTPTGDGNVVVNTVSGVALSLSTTGVTPGTYTAASLVVDAHGRVLSATSGTVQSNTVTLVGDVAGSGPLTNVTTTLASVITAGTYVKVVVDSKGRVINAVGLTTADLTTALGATPLTSALLGIANGVASLDATGLVSLGALPLTALANSLTTTIANVVATSISNAATLSPTGVATGTYTNATIVVGADGRITAASTGSGSGSATLTGAISGSGPLSDVVTTITPSGVAAGTYTDATIVVGADGRITSAASGTGGGGGASSATLTGAISGSGPLSNIVTTLSSSAVTGALGYTPLNATLLGAANGAASLDGNGRLLTSELPSAITGAVVYQGTWDAFANIPTLTSSVGTKGNYYKVSNAGSTNLNGITTWLLNDTAIYDGLVWDKIAGQDSAVVSVAGRVGVVTLSVTDVANAVSNSTLQASLSGYVSNSTLQASLGGYVSNSALQASLGGYVSNSTLQTSLSTYVSNSALQTTLGSYVLTTTRGAANGVASLDATGRVPLSQLPTSLGSGSVGSVGITSNTITVTGSPITSNGVIDIELPSIANVAGSYVSPSVLTVDSYGRLTHIANGSTGGSSTTTLTGDVTGTGTGTIATTLAPSGVTAGTYTNPTVTVNAKGLVTTIASGSSSGTSSGLQVFSFQVNFDSTGNIAATNSFTNTPSGWTLTLVNNTTVQVTHNLSTFPTTITTVAYNSGNNAFTFKSPNANYGTSLNAYIPGTSTTPNSFILSGLTASYTNATASEFVIVQIII